MANAFTANNKCPEVKGCVHVSLATTTDYKLRALRGVAIPEKKALKNKLLDILISKNQVLQILYLIHHAYKAS